MVAQPRLTLVKIQGYRPFRDFNAQLEPLEILVGEVLKNIPQITFL